MDIDDTEGVSPQRQMLMQRVSYLWPRVVKTSEEVKQRAFTDWGDEDNIEAWKQISVAQAERIIEVHAAADAANTGPLSAMIRGQQELSALGAAVELIDTGATGVRLRGEAQGVRVQAMDVEGPSYVQDVSDAMARARQTGPKGPLAEWIADAEVTGAQMVAGAKVTAIDADVTAAALVMTPEAFTVRVKDKFTKGKHVRVDRIDGSLLEMVKLHVQSQVDMAQLELTAVSVSSTALVNSVLAAVLRSAAIPGVDLSPEGEVMVDLISRAGDLNRSMSVDANLIAMGEELKALRKTVNGVRSAMTVTVDSAAAASLLSSFNTSERLGLFKLGYPVVLDDVKFDLAAGLNEKALAAAAAARKNKANQQWRDSGPARNRKKDA